MSNLDLSLINRIIIQLYRKFMWNDYVTMWPLIITTLLEKLDLILAFAEKGRLKSPLKAFISSLQELPGGSHES